MSDAERLDLHDHVDRWMLAWCEAAVEAMKMEKYGVSTPPDDPKVKTASVTGKCPKCGSALEQHGEVPKCPKCGTKPFEAAPK